jgi:hypothetical protein
LEGTGAVTAVTVARTGGLVCDGDADKVKLVELVVEMAGVEVDELDKLVRDEDDDDLVVEDVDELCAVEVGDDVCEGNPEPLGRADEWVVEVPLDEIIR